ncbi:unnamed protein product [Rotaria socialis]|uniref:Uncharacterized protein n=1 Tax=Rotaria socialis TaxID=392032 RepID=A0A818B4K8_9BILA|nr:unnamed protein product [Rotaria socialis]CAF3412959.1 unnamed protein product [Rotaria socialis]CAF4540177.1 unnamed protein product [Rotaria socialis]CAF4561870.1 unnamed protein product [Rotaria socialis]
MGNTTVVSPADRLLQEKRRRAMNKKCATSDPNEFYCAGRDGNIDYVRQNITKMSKKDINYLEGNDTALHVATRNNHVEVVQLLLNAGISRTIINKYGKMPHEESTSPEMKSLYTRVSTTRFYESNPESCFDTFASEDIKPNESSAQVDTRKKNDTSQKESSSRVDFIKTFENENQLDDYSLNQETAAMWFKFFKWVSRTFSGVLNRADFRSDLFNLESDRDFDEFLKQAAPDNEAYKQTVKALIQAERSNDIVPLITLYTSEYGGEKVPFYDILNNQLALVSGDYGNTAHFCDRFVYEFSMKNDTLAQHAFVGKSYRGIRMSQSTIERYKKLAELGKNGIIATKTFTSTSKIDTEALRFIEKSKNKQERPVLFIFNIWHPCKTIIDVTEVSCYPEEEEVLIIPGNLFRICSVTEKPELTEIRLEQKKINISTFRKIRHTLKAMQEKFND